MTEHSQEKTAIVVTSIAGPNAALQALAGLDEGSFNGNILLALAKIGSEALPALGASLHSGDAVRRAEAAWALVTMKPLPSEAVGLVKQLVGGESS